LPNVGFEDVTSSFATEVLETHGVSHQGASRDATARSMTAPAGTMMVIPFAPSPPSVPSPRGTERFRPGAALYLVCVLALAAGGGLLGVRLLQTGAQTHAHTAHGPVGLASPVRTSFGQFQVESIEQIRGLTPKALAGVTHGIQSLVQADHMQVQLVLALQNEGGRPVAYDPAKFRLRVLRGTKSPAFESVTTSVRAGVLTPKSVMEATIGFVIPRFNPKGTRLSLEYLDQGARPLTLDLGPVRPGGSAASIRAAGFGHQH
jgi:hypothetical protein